MVEGRIKHAKYKPTKKEVGEAMVRHGRMAAKASRKPVKKARLGGAERGEFEAAERKDRLKKGRTAATLITKGLIKKNSGERK